jgi:myo-inositol-1(or 4)-monophosphatase
MSLPSRAELETVAVRAGELALGHFRRAVAVRKADRTLVTEADREVEALLVAELGALFPEAGILGEEGATRPASGPYRLVFDPIDGTSVFISGLPTWCVCIGILRDGQAVAGVVHAPAAAETYVAHEGRAWWNGAPLPRLAGRADEPDPFVVVHARAHLRHRLTYPGKARSFGSSAYHMALVARGAAEGALIYRASLWDLAAPAALLAAVGGRLEYLGGGTVDLGALADGDRTPDYILAGAPEKVAALRPLLGGA